MSMEREAEVLGLPTHGEKSPSQAKSVAQGRGVVERYVERLETGAQRLHSEPEASELFCALAELRQGLIETDLPQAEQLYLQALSAFKLCHVANAGLRRLQRGRGDFEGVIAILLRDLTTASANRRQALQLELARTWLYCACDPERAIAVLETLREEGENGGEDAFDAERFFLWEDALLASGAWDRYEALLRKAMAQQTNAGPLTQRLAARLWMLYRYVLPDESQAEVLRKHLLAMQASDDELILETLAQAEKAGNRDGVVDILCQAMERDAGSPLEVFYRLHMADVAHYEYEDLEHAVEVIREGLERHPFDLSLLRRKISLQAERGDKEGLLEALTQSLEAMHTPKLKAEQLHMIACILRDDMDQEESAMDVFLEANRICPTYGPTNVALSEIYLREENYSDLAQMLEYELSYAIEHQDAHYTAEVLIDKHARLAWIYEEKLCFGLKAFHHYQAILKHRAPDIAALKGASRMAQGIGNWTELLKLYAAAEGCTQDTQEHIYLLERIAHIADVYLNDADTACTALEALRSIEPRHAGAVPALSRLYVKLKKWDSLIALTDEEVDWVTNPEYKASLLCRNGEISEQALSNMPQAILYYEKARTLWPGSRQAYGALGRLYRQQKAHEKLVDLWKAQAGVTQDPAQKCEYLHRVARILITNLDAEEEALEVYESCLKHCPGDAIARKMLLEAYEKEGRWQDVLRILKLELKAGGSYGQVWLTHEWMGRIQQYLIGDASAALASYAEAFSANPANIALLRTWLALSLRLGTEDQTIDRLKAALEVVNDDTARYEIAMALADLTMKATHDPADIAPLIKPYAKKALKQATRFLRAFLPAVCARDGEWIEAMTMAFADEAVEEEKCHALLAAMILDMPQVLRKRAHAVLCSLKDDAMAADLWAALPPYQRPDHKALKKTVLSGTSHDAQDLRRWCAISRLLAGDVSDPTERLLPESRDTAISYRVDLELLAAYFERFEKWLKLLEVLSVQKENTLNEQEQIQVTLQRAWVLSKIKKPDEALASAREACRACSYGNPMRSALYDYLSHEKDWDFLLEQIRQHLMNEEDKAQAAILWMRLANIYGTGMSNPEESLRCLDQAYHANPSKGSILVEISEVAHRLGEIDIARRALDDYIHYHDPSLNEQLGLAPKLLDLHFNVAGGDAPRMIAYFETLVQKTAQSRDCLITLAKAHAKAGDPHIAAETLLRIVAYPFVEEDLSLWLILADLYQNRLGEATKGEELLWKLFATYPKAEEVFERLDRLYIEPAERRIFVENLKHYVKTSQPIATDPILVRKLLSFAARILSTELGLWSEAQELYSAAIE
ncbi:MAG: hypothetical protein FWC40_07735, partial [Proteobacteria bacterium]|nr:hypothetical protein [Pseudomonadota bacterium]